MKPSPTNAGQIAKSLAARFLENGNYEALGVPMGREAALKYAQAAALDAVDEVFGAEEGFAGLAVQSVGYTAGAESEKVVIYVARGSQKELRALPKEVDGVEVTAYVMGKLRAGPTAGLTRSGHFFERAGRIACGGSCAPSGAGYAGTLGPFVQDGARQFALSNNHVFAACNHTPVGLHIVAPSGYDVRPDRRAPTAFSRHERII